MSLISASYFKVPADKEALACGVCVVEIEAIGADERMNLGAEKEIKLRSLLPEKERKERRQVLLRTGSQPPLLNKADIVDYFPNLLGLQLQRRILSLSSDEL